MSRAEWAAPVIIGLAAAGLTWAFVPDDIQRLGHDVVVHTDAPYVLVPAPGTASHDTTLLRYNATNTQHGLGKLLDIHAGLYQNGTFAWDGNGWECLGAEPACRPDEPSLVVLHPPQDPGDSMGPATQADGPVGGDDAATTPTANPADADNSDGGAALFSVHNATADLTFYVFTSSGHLLTTNALRSQWDAYDLHGEFTHFSSTTWHLGPDPAPEGARTLPMFRAEAMALLDGTPVGGVQSAVLEEHPYEWLVGPLWVTARVDLISEDYRDAEGWQTDL